MMAVVVQRLDNSAAGANVSILAPSLEKNKTENHIAFYHLLFFLPTSGESKHVLLS